MERVFCQFWQRSSTRCETRLRGDVLRDLRTCLRCLPCSASCGASALDPADVAGRLFAASTRAPADRRPRPKAECRQFFAIQGKLPALHPMKIAHDLQPVPGVRDIAGEELKDPQHLRELRSRDYRHLCNTRPRVSKSMWGCPARVFRTCSNPAAVGGLRQHLAGEKRPKVLAVADHRHSNIGETHMAGVDLAAFRRPASLLGGNIGLGARLLLVRAKAVHQIAKERAG